MLWWVWESISLSRSSRFDWHLTVCVYDYDCVPGGDTNGFCSSCRPLTTTENLFVCLIYYSIRVLLLCVVFPFSFLHSADEINSHTLHIHSHTHTLNLPPHKVIAIRTALYRGTSPQPSWSMKDGGRCTLRPSFSILPSIQTISICLNISDRVVFGWWCTHIRNHQCVVELGEQTPKSTIYLLCEIRYDANIFCWAIL